MAQQTPRILTDFEVGTTCRQSVPQLPSSGFLDWCQVNRWTHLCGLKQQVGTD